jgi:ERCC4-related helicase
MGRAHASVTVIKVDFAWRRRNYIICFPTKPLNVDGLHIEYLEPPVLLFSTNELKLQTSVSAPYSQK